MFACCLHETRRKLVGSSPGGRARGSTVRHTAPCLSLSVGERSRLELNVVSVSETVQRDGGFAYGRFAFHRDPPRVRGVNRSWEFPSTCLERSCECVQPLSPIGIGVLAEEERGVRGPGPCGRRSAGPWPEPRAESKKTPRRHGARDFFSSSWRSCTV